MSQLDTMFGEVAAPDFIEKFAESITYHPNGESDRVIQGTIEREPRRGIDGVPISTRAPFAIITVRDDAAVGISSTEINEAKDQISYPVRTGEAAARRSVGKSAKRRGGLLRIEIR